MKKVLVAVGVVGMLLMVFWLARQEQQPYQVETYQEQINENLAFAKGLSLITEPDGSQVVFWSELQNHKNSNPSAHLKTVTIAAEDLRMTAPSTVITTPFIQNPISASASATKRIVTFGAMHEKAMQQFFIGPSTTVAALQTVKGSGHSGRVASTKDSHIIAWGEGAKNSGGLGQAERLHLSVYDDAGSLIDEALITTREEDQESWPRLAASSTRALLIWQRAIEEEDYVQLMYALYDPKAQRFQKRPLVLQPNNAKEAYQVNYVEPINAFVVTGNTRDNQGYMYIINETGRVTHGSFNLPPFVQETTPAIKQGQGSAELTYPMAPSGFITYEVTENQVAEKRQIFDEYVWEDLGTAGVYKESGEIYFITLSEHGIVEKIIHKRGES